MDEDRNNQEEISNSGSSSVPWIVTSVAVLALAVAGVLFYYNFQQKSMIAGLTSQESGMNTTISDLKGQLDDTTSKLNEVSAQQAAAVEANANQAKSRAAAGPSPAETKRLQQLQAGLDEQKQEMESTQSDLSQTRSDLEGSMNSTRDELNGSIAKNHDELVQLEKRGERDYIEFDAGKSKGFQRTGPLGVSLRRIDPKHDNVDMMVLVNDRQISKKKVNLYEPVWIYQDKDAEPMQVVVNKITANSVHGYISTPKYSASELNTSTGQGSVQPPAPASGSSSPEDQGTE
jgi:hypothetical protein